MVVIFCFLRFTPFTPSRWISFLVLTFSSTARAVRRVPGTGYRDNQVLSFIHSKQWKLFVPRKVSNNRNMYAQTTIATMKHTSCEMEFSQRCWQRFRPTGAWRCVIWQPPTFRKASCLHLRHLGSPKRTPDHSKWRHMAEYLNLQKTSSALHFAQSIGKQPFRTSNPYHSETGLYQKCKGPKLFRFRQVPFHIGTKVRILGLQGFYATDRFPLRPRSE